MSKENVKKGKKTREYEKGVENVKKKGGEARRQCDRQLLKHY